MKTKLLHCFVAVLGIVLLSATSTTAQSAATATVVVYRPNKLFSWNVNYDFFNDTRELCRLGKGRYMITTVPAGMVTLRSHVSGFFVWPLKTDTILRFAAKAGETYFVQTDIMGYNMGLAPAEYARTCLQRITKSDDCAQCTGI
ncbi:hypothetical protein MTX78_04425 [Hymenobacter tibetensis]|uniref:Uncharacterized protein n=1 Tax=Hymenobacter tibetensis TaxID=497967 RepID=A0ABY4D0I2_9BACT|nr:hypothetical protein [Hymenobacter tibetensis]UOG75847.1 hypothetical protein MTX78_04425 [Hymenobacter tibetensis]